MPKRSSCESSWRSFRTRDSLLVCCSPELFELYWQNIEPEERPGPFGLGFKQAVKSDTIAEIELALARPEPLDDEQWDKYFGRLAWAIGTPEDDGEGLKPPPGCQNDLSNSKRVLTGMGCSDADVRAVHRIVGVFGAKCDCEILFNAAEKILPPDND